MSSIFVNPLLIWGLALAALPVLIHLINLMRHRRVQWAAMEFLLQSQRKNSRWVRLKELLLLLARVAAIGLVVLVLAQPLLSDALSRRLGGRRVEHLVLLDDSYSMSDRWGDTTAYDVALQSLQRYGRQIANEGAAQSFTLLRFSRATLRDGRGEPEVSHELVDQEFGSRLAERLARMTCSETAIGPGAAIQAARRWLDDAAGAEPIVYLLTDFRTKDWDQPRDLAAALGQLEHDGARLEFINCVDAARPNLAISALAPQPVTRAAGVSLTYDVTVTNFGSQPVRDISVAIEQDGVAASLVKFETIPAGGRETRSFQVLFPTAGPHTIAARLPSDAVAADNVRYSQLELPTSVPALVVEGDANAPDARLLAAVLNPGGAVKTGIDVRVEPPAFLNNNALEGFEVVYLADVERLDDVVVTNLEKFVRRGGGVVFFLGPKTSVDFFNRQLYHDGSGLFPAPLLADTQLLVNRLERAADIEATDHPVFRAFAGERSAFLAGVTVERFMLTARDWQPRVDSGVQTIARLRNRAPLAIERTLGAGRVIAMLTSAGPAWNNWARDPSFVVTLLQLQAYLSPSSVQPTAYLVGEPLTAIVEPARYLPRATFIPPAQGEAQPATADLTPTPRGLQATFPDTSHAGIYELQLTTTDGRVEPRRYALNVDPAEGELNILDSAALSARLPGLHYEYRQAERFGIHQSSTAGSNLSDTLLYLLVALLVGEQVLAWLTSYHRPPSESSRPAEARR